jgi:hypothetical protein
MYSNTGKHDANYMVVFKYMYAFYLSSIEITIEHRTVPQ